MKKIRAVTPEEVVEIENRLGKGTQKCDWCDCLAKNHDDPCKDFNRDCDCPGYYHMERNNFNLERAKASAKVMSGFIYGEK